MSSRLPPPPLPCWPSSPAPSLSSHLPAEATMGALLLPPLGGWSSRAPATLSSPLLIPGESWRPPCCRSRESPGIQVSSKFYHFSYWKMPSALYKLLSTCHLFIALLPSKTWHDVSLSVPTECASGALGSGRQAQLRHVVALESYLLLCNFSDLQSSRLKRGPDACFQGSSVSCMESTCPRTWRQE